MYHKKYLNKMKILVTCKFYYIEGPYFDRCFWQCITNAIIANDMPCSRNRDIKCNRICKLPLSSSFLDTFYDPYSFF